MKKGDEMKIYIARHGETEYNVQDRVCGVTDIDLTLRGVEQAKRLAESVAQKHIDVMRVSPLKRAIQTADIIAARCGLAYEIEPRLIEENFGDNEGVPRLHAGFAYAKRNLGVRQPGGDSFIRIAHRAYGLIEETYEKYPDENVLWVCHGTLARAIRTYFVDMTNDEIFEYNMENCELVEYEMP